MEETNFNAPEESSAMTQAVSQLKQSAATMSTWLKFLGIISIVGGALTAITVIGILVAWLPIWLGILLFQAGDRAASLQYSGDLNALVQMMDKLKTYFVISAVVTIVVLVFSIMSAFFTASLFRELTTQFPDILQSY